MKVFSLTMFRRGRLSNIYLLLAVVVSAPSVAAEWAVEPSVALKEEYNDNIHMRVADHPSVWGTTLSPSAKFSGRSETLDVKGGVRINFNRYSGETGLDTTDHLFTFSSIYKIERNSLRLDASLTRDSTITEWAKTGFIVTRKQRRTTTLEPSWTSALTERLQFNASYAYSDVGYETDPNLTNYKYRKLTGVLQYYWSEKDQVFFVASDENLNYANSSVQVDLRFGKIDLSAFFGPGAFTYGYSGGGRYSVSDNSSKTRNYMVGVSHDFTDTLNGTLKIGRRNTNSSAVISCNGNITVPYCSNNGTEATLADPLITFQRDTKTSGSSLDGSLSQQFENMSFKGTISRGLNASATGLVETTNADITAANKFSEKMTGQLNFSVYQTKYLGVQTATSDSRYLTVQPKLSWQLSEWWVIDAAYGYAKQKSGGAAQAVAANSVYVNLIYNWPKISVSR